MIWACKAEEIGIYCSHFLQRHSCGTKNNETHSHLTFSDRNPVKEKKLISFHYRCGITVQREEKVNLAVPNTKISMKPLTIQREEKTIWACYLFREAEEIGIYCSHFLQRHSCGTKSNGTRSHELILWLLLREIQ
ncbi:hypothetical protein CEXT_336311 [Caerostris extrusa]|uniref:Uncharacterized protein n=1 Tax=Caerostris extrusa TaxID=172846 RepID=A0AAV4UYT5_CAEEX|nr:hypothetical protein CEXT_336311 [Caerostris extrusa]